MVDALASGASTGNGVEVRVLSWAPIILNIDALKGPFSWTFSRFGARILTIVEHSIPTENTSVGGIIGGTPKQDEVDTPNGAHGPED